MNSMQEFYLFREEDVSRVSGTGIVARGVVLPSGKVVLEWVTFHSSLAIYSNIQDVELIHSHEGKTKIVMVEKKEVKKRKKK